VIHHESTTLLLTVYRRPQLLPGQLAAALGQTVRPRVWVLVQHPARAAELDLTGADRVLECAPNSYFHLRFAVLLTAQSDWVATWDDDLNPGGRWLEHCLATARHTTGILGASGVRHLGQEHYGQAHRYWGCAVQNSSPLVMDYVGGTWFLRPRWIAHLFADSCCTNNGDDIELGCRAYRLGGVRSYLLPHPPGRPERWSTTQTSQGLDGAASWRRPGWGQQRLDVYRREVAAGFVSVARRRAVLQGHDRFLKSLSETPAGAAATLRRGGALGL